MKNLFIIMASAAVVGLFGWTNFANAQAEEGPGGCASGNCPPSLSISILPTMQLEPTLTRSVCCENVNGIPRVFITIGGFQQSGSQPIQVTITGPSTLNLGAIFINSSAVEIVQVRILGNSGSNSRIGSIGGLSKGNSVGDKIWLLELRTVGDVGQFDRPAGDDAFIVDQFGALPNIANQIIIGGSLRGGVRIATPNRGVGPISIGGSMFGNFVMAPGCSINRLEVNGDITGVGSARAQFVVPVNINVLRARGIFADFYGGGTLANPVPMGTINRFETTAGSGGYDGSIVADRIAPVSGATLPAGFLITGDLLASIRLSESITVPFNVSGGLIATRLGGIPNVVRIGSSLSSGQTLTFGGPLAGTLDIAGSLAGIITVPSSGLPGQIIVNSSSTTGTWTGSVNIGSGANLIALTAPPDGKYTQLPASLGGGSVGLAPFRLHEPACIPPHNAVAVGQGLADGAFGTGLFPVRIRHYGPLRFVGTARPTVQARVSESDPCQWIDLAGFAFRGPGDAGWTDPNSIGVGAATGVLIKQGIYRVIFNSGTLVSDVTNSPDVVWPVICDVPSYVFRVFCDSNLDLMDDSTQSVA